jgi:hypothetical protein
MADDTLKSFSGNNPIATVKGAIDPTALGKNALSNFQGMLSTKPVAKYMSGARTIIKINGRIAAFATGVSWKITTESKEIWGIDNYMPQEIVPNKIMVSGTINGLVIPGNGPTNQLITPDVLSFLFHKHIAIEVRDSQTDSLLFYTGRATIVDRQDNVKSGQLANITLRFKAIAYRDEKIPEYPRGAEGSDQRLKANRSPVERLTNVAKKWFNNTF